MIEQEDIECWKELLAVNTERLRKLESGELRCLSGPTSAPVDVSAEMAADLRQRNAYVRLLIERFIGELAGRG